jgi:hypothetical protein
VGILVSGCRRRGPGDRYLAADSARLGQRRSLLHPSHRATANGPHGSGHRQAPSLCRGCTKACERGDARPDRVAPSQRADDQSDQAFASIERSHLPIKERLRPMRGLHSIATGQRLLEGIEITQAIGRGELRATIGDGDLAIKRCPYEAARETVEIFTSLANDLCSAV